MIRTDLGILVVVALLFMEDQEFAGGHYTFKAENAVMKIWKRSASRHGWLGPTNSLTQRHEGVTTNGSRYDRMRSERPRNTA